MFDCGWAGSEQPSTAFGYAAHVPQAFLRAADPALPFETLAQRDRDCPSHGIAG